MKIRQSGVTPAPFERAPRIDEAMVVLIGKETGREAESEEQNESSVLLV